MSISISSLKNIVIAGMHGTTANQINNFNGLINKAASQFVLDYDPPETKRYVQIASVFTNDYDYAVPADLKGDKIIDIFPMVNRDYSNNFTGNFNRLFDRTKSMFGSLNGGTNFGNKFTLLWNNFSKTVRIDYLYGQPVVVVNTTNTLSDNGTWIPSGMQNLYIDTVTFANNTSSISMDIPTGIGTLTDTLSMAIDLGTNYQQGSFFIWFYFTNGTSLTNVTLTVGQSVTNAVSIPVTQTSSGTAFQNGWNLLQFNLGTVTSLSSLSQGIQETQSPQAIILCENGTPLQAEAQTNDFACNYVQVAFTGTAFNTAKMSEIDFNVGSILEMEYYSKYLFRDGTTGTFKETVTLDTDNINLDTDAWNCFASLVQYYIARQQAGSDSSFDYVSYKQDYDTQLAKLRAMYKSEVMPLQDIYYAKPNVSYRKVGRFY